MADKKLGRARYVLFAGLPFLILCAFMLCNASDVPWADEWAFVPFLEKWHTGTLVLTDLLRQHNEHRLFFPYLIEIPLAAATHWNLRYVVALNLLLGTGICAILFHQIRKLELFWNETFDRTYFVVALFAFSLTQCDNWIFDNVPLLMCVISCLAGIFLLSAPRLSPARLLGAMAAGVIATLSFANGMLFWAIGTAILFLRPIERRRRSVLAAWIALAAAMIIAYFHGYQKPSNHPSLFFVLQHPFRSAGYFAAFLGNTLLPYNRLKVVVLACSLCGLAGLSAFAYLSYLSLKPARENRAAWLTLLPWFAMGAFAVISAGISMVGRAGFGVAQATASRYVTVSDLMWIPIVVLWPILMRPSMESGPRMLAEAARSRVLRNSCLFIFLALQAGAIGIKWRWTKGHVTALEKVRAELVSGDLNDASIKAESYPADAAARVAVLKKYRLAFFRD